MTPFDCTKHNLYDGKSSCRKHVIGKPRKTSKPYDLLN